MAPRPISERLPEPFDHRSIREDLPNYAPGGDTPSPRTPTTIGSLSPPPFESALVPVQPEPGIPLDHTLPHYIREVSGEGVLEDVQNMSLRVMTETASLQQMTLYTPNLRELNLEGSGLSSLRDIGSELRFLQVLRIGRCRLRSLDGTLGLTNLRELHAQGNSISSAAPCAHLTHLRVLDLSRNRLQDTRSLGFLSCCKRLHSLKLAENPVAGSNQLENFLRELIPTLRALDDADLTPPAVAAIEDAIVYEREDSLTSSDFSRVSSASSATTSSFHLIEGEELSLAAEDEAMAPERDEAP